MQPISVQDHINNLHIINNDIEHNQNEDLQANKKLIKNDSFDILDDSGISYDSGLLVRSVEQDFINRIEKFRVFLQTNTQIWHDQFDFFSREADVLRKYYPVLTPFILDISWLNQNLECYIKDFEAQTNHGNNDTFQSDKSEDESEDKSEDESEDESEDKSEDESEDESKDKYDNPDDLHDSYNENQEEFFHNDDSENNIQLHENQIQSLETRQVSLKVIKAIQGEKKSHKGYINVTINNKK